MVARDGSRTPRGRFVPAGVPREPWQFLGRGGGPRICRISREISRRREIRRTHVLHGRPTPVPTSLHHALRRMRAATIRLNYTPNIRHMDTDVERG